VPETLPVKIDDGGRTQSGMKAKRVGDCVCRALAIVTGNTYDAVYQTINSVGASERLSKRRKRRSSARNGVYKPTVRKLMEQHGGVWTPTMGIGSGCRVHLRKGEFPESGKYVACLSKHVCAVIDGVIHDTFDPSRNGTRCVYGYWRFDRPEGQR